jgi:hypothetical protein
MYFRDHDDVIRYIADILFSQCFGENVILGCYLEAFVNFIRCFNEYSQVFYGNKLYMEFFNMYGVSGYFLQNLYDYEYIRDAILNDNKHVLKYIITNAKHKPNAIRKVLSTKVVYVKLRCLKYLMKATDETAAIANRVSSSFSDIMRGDYKIENLNEYIEYILEHKLVDPSTILPDLIWSNISNKFIVDMIEKYNMQYEPIMVSNACRKKLAHYCLRKYDASTVFISILKCQLYDEDFINGIVVAYNIKNVVVDEISVYSRHSPELYIAFIRKGVIKKSQSFINSLTRIRYDIDELKKYIPILYEMAPCTVCFKIALYEYDRSYTVKPRHLIALGWSDRMCEACKAVRALLK